MATFKQYRDEKTGNMQWGVLIAFVSTVKPGDKVTVTKRNGKTKIVELLDRVQRLDNGDVIWSIVGGSKPRRGRYIPRDGKCKGCGKAIPSKYELCLGCKDNPVEVDMQELEQRAKDAVQVDYEAEQTSADPFPEW